MLLISPHTGCHVSSKVDVFVSVTVNPLVRDVSFFNSSPSLLGRMTGRPLYVRLYVGTPPGCSANVSTRFESGDLISFAEARTAIAMTQQATSERKELTNHIDKAHREGFMACQV